ncbi:universal stress protein [Halomicroarcula sp. GCM10025817]|uniref:universal stress protein n=1 Tax=Haloarcula TaxID=2237 RepID=UPI0023E7C9C0|nr:universal stress protein [Halomicroarcula sp. SYNS111]
MVDHVLVAIDGSPLSRRALEFALEVHPDATITLLRVVDYIEESYGAEMLVGPTEIRERALSKAEELLAEASEQARDHEGTVETVTEFGKPARVIPEYAGDNDVDVIVLGGHGRSLVSRVLLGDVAQRVVQQAPVPVTVVR